MDKAAHSATDRPPGIIGPLMRWTQGLCAAAIAVLWICPTSWIESGPILCPFRRFWGIECYGCGTTRALSYLLHGQIDSALSYNRGAVWVLAILMAVVLTAAWAPRRQRTV